MSAWSPWTDEEDALLVAAHREGRTDAEVAALLHDRTETAVRKRRQRLGLTEPAVVIDRERLRELHAAGMTTKAMAAALGATYRTTQELLHREGLRTKRTGRPPRLRYKLSDELAHDLGIPATRLVWVGPQRADGWWPVYNEDGYHGIVESLRGFELAQRGAGARPHP